MSNDFMYFSKILLNPGVSGLSDISSFIVKNQIYISPMHYMLICKAIKLTPQSILDILSTC